MQRDAKKLHFRFRNLNFKGLLKMSVFYNLAMILSVVVLCLSTFTLFQLVSFLSPHQQLQPFFNIGQSYLQCGTWQCKATINACLVAAFMLQHSLQKRKTVKMFFEKHGWGCCERLLYNLGSSVALLSLMNFWQPIPDWCVWEVGTSHRPSLWWLFFLIHAACWLFIYTGCYIMDISELLGAKQVFHSLQDLPDPLSRKSEGLQRFCSHMRHPSFSAVGLILFAHPVMQVDRLLLGHALVAYMALRTQVDEVDYAYQKRLLQRKHRDLHCATD